MKISMLTLGCKVNQYEAECIASNLRKAGHDVVETLEPADVYVLSTCAVTNEAERKSRQMLAKLRKLNPNAKIVVKAAILIRFFFIAKTIIYVLRK